MASEAQGAGGALGSRSSRRRCPVAIIGAGLTGMAAAHRLGELGIEHRILERTSVPGGHAITIEEDGYRFDRTGHLLHVADPEVRALALGWIGSEYREIERHSAIWSHGVFTRYPFQANLYGLPPKVVSECLLGFVQAHERARAEPSPAAARNFEEYCLATFGSGISQHFMIPYNSRLWGVAPSEITADWCSRFVPVPSLEDVMAGAAGHDGPELGYNIRFIFPKGGIGRLTQGLARAVGCIEHGRAPKTVRVATRQLELEDDSLRYDVLINTAPLPRLVELFDYAPADVQQAARELRCTHLYYLDLALSTPCGQPYQWVYVPEAKYPFYRVGCYSHFSPEMAPPGKAGLYVELVDRDEPVLAELLPRVAAGLVEMGFIADPAHVAFARLRRIDYAYVIFDHRYYSALKSIRPYLRKHRILSTGRYGGWDYSAMGDALRYGREAAEAAARLLGQDSEP